jgi:hypothetical protein
VSWIESKEKIDFFVHWKMNNQHRQARRIGGKKAAGKRQVDQWEVPVVLTAGKGHVDQWEVPVVLTAGVYVLRVNKEGGVNSYTREVVVR